MRCNVPFAGFLRTTFHPKNGKALTQPVAAMLAALSAEEEPEVFVSPPPEELKCVICFDWLRDPVITRSCGHTFCRICFERSAYNKPSCPTCRASLEVESSREIAVAPNRVVKGILEGLLIHCRYGLKKNSYTGEWEVDPTRCQKTIKRGERLNHERVCDFAPASCIHRERGCNFQGTRMELDAHLRSCTFEMLKDYITENEEQKDMMRKQLRAQELEIQLLKKKLDCLYRAILQPEAQDVESIAREFLIGKDWVKKERQMEKELMLQEARKQKEEDTIRQALKGKHISCVCTLTSHDDTVESLVTDEQHLYSASWDNTIKIWNSTSLDSAHTLTCNSDVRELLIDGNKLYSGCGTGTIQVWDLDELKCTQTVKKHMDDVLTLQMANGRLFSGSSDSTIRVWDPASEIDSEDSGDIDTGSSSRGLACLDTLNGHTNWVFALAFAEGMLFSASSDHTIKVWSTETLKCTHTLTGHSDQVRALSVANGNLFSGSYDCTIKVWDIKTLQCVQTLHVYNEVFGLGTAAGFLFSGDENGTIKIWDLSSRRCTHTLSDHTGSVYAFAVANGHLLSASSDTTIKVWQ